MRKFLILASASAAFAASPLAAQTPQQQKPITRAQFDAQLNAQFGAIDTNHDGKISREELMAAQQRDLEQARLKLRQSMEARFHQLDTNHDGQLSLQEFLAAAPGLHPTTSADQIFQQLDTNHDGKVTAAEFKNPRLQQFDRADTNHDGVVTPAEMQAAQPHK